MYSAVSLTSIVLVISQCIFQTMACVSPARRQTTEQGGEVTYPFIDPGDDRPSPIETSGYFINHLCINVRNLTESVDWYNKALGLRLMFTMHVSEHLSISYMGHAQAGRNSSGYQTSQEMVRDQNNLSGLLELLHLDIPSWDLPAGITTPNTFHHIGMVVPDAAATQKHLEDIGANILKPYNEVFTVGGAFANAAGLVSSVDYSQISQEERELVGQILGPLNTPLIIVTDPDGNIVEIQARDIADVGA